MRVPFSSSDLSRLILLALASMVIGFASVLTVAQQTNPVDRKVTNPMTDTPNVNPLTPERLRGWAETSLDSDGRLTDFLS